MLAACFAGALGMLSRASAPRPVRGFHHRPAPSPPGGDARARAGGRGAREARAHRDLIEISSRSHRDLIEISVDADLEIAVEAPAHPPV